MRGPILPKEKIVQAIEILIDHLSYLKFLLQDTKQTISIVQG
jgi:hypothetical protein